MRSAFAYTPRPGPIGDAGAGAALAYFGAFAVIAFSFTNPIVLAAVAVGVVVAGLRSGAHRALAAGARYGVALGLVFVAVNAIAAQRGETILIRGFDLPVLGRIDVSAEALAEGAVLAGRVLVVLLAFAVLSASVDPDRLLRLFRPLARRSALTATLIVRMVPLAARDHARLREAAALRGPGAAAVGRAATLRRLVAGSLDRSVDVAATLELRGYARGAPRRASSPPAGRHSHSFWVAGLALAGCALAARIGGVGAFDAYPVIALDTGLPTLAFAVAIGVLAAAPFALASLSAADRRPLPRGGGAHA
ncbi:MAG: energy-coupling factor transporter transmembrane component T [bacterium]